MQTIVKLFANVSVALTTNVSDSFSPTKNCQKPPFANKKWGKKLKCVSNIQNNTVAI